MSAGIGGTITSNFDRKDFVNISSVGSGYQYFKYPEVKVEIKYTNVGSSAVNDLITTPVVKGKLVMLTCIRRVLDMDPHRLL